MFIITNREVNNSARGLARLGATPNIKGPNELRLVEAEKKSRSWSITILPDEITPAMRKRAGIKQSETPVYASEYVARILFARIRKEKRNLLFFVHGYNNDIKALLERANTLEKLYGVEVLAFSWPANGGGLRGVASYKSDKRDAKASVGAFDRCLGRFNELLTKMTETEIEHLHIEAKTRFPDDSEKREQYFAKLMEKRCPLTVNMMLHSMGNYLYKHTLLSTVGNGMYLSFDNVIMAAADTNNAEHALWVDRIPCRKAVYITINENDSALLASRMKAGEQQQARLGHFRHNLNSTQATYVDFTDATNVGNSHAYFEGTPVRSKKSPVRQFFQKAFNGQRAEQALEFDPANRMYLIERQASHPADNI